MLGELLQRDRRTFYIWWTWAVWAVFPYLAILCNACQAFHKIPQWPLGGGFKYFLFSPLPGWGNDPIWLIFFRWVETTNQMTISGLFQDQLSVIEVAPLLPTLANWCAYVTWISLYPGTFWDIRKQQLSFFFRCSLVKYEIWNHFKHGNFLVHGLMANIQLWLQNKLMILQFLFQIEAV